MKLSVITLTYNHLNYTKKFIQSLYKYTQNFELIIVDNGSTDGTVEYLKSLNGVKIIFNEKNEGFSKGNNQGLQIAEGEYIGFLNNDILLYPKWFEECEKIFQNENAAFVSPRHVNPHFDNTNEKKYIEYFKKNFNYESDYNKSFDDCVFSCVLTKRSVLNKIGSFDENYKQAFFEDNDLKYRAILANYDIYVANKVCFFHFGSITSANLDNNLSTNRAYYYSIYPFAEYLSASSAEMFKMQVMLKRFKKFPLNNIYQIYCIGDKIKNRLKKGLFKH